MRGVMRDALARVADHGLPGDHHFYITFVTTAPDVQMANVLRAQYPDTMTIVLQHKFWDLAVDQTGFGVTLSFGGAQQRLYVPFAAVTGFVDPSVNFGFTFEHGAAESTTDEGSAEGEGPAAGAEETGQVVTLDKFRKK